VPQRRSDALNETERPRPTPAAGIDEMRADVEMIVANIRVRKGDPPPDKWLERLADALVGWGTPAQALASLKRDVWHFRSPHAMDDPRVQAAPDPEIEVAVDTCS
jgi:hypothetical protein